MNILVRRNKGSFNHIEDSNLQKDIDLLIALFEDAPCDVFLTGGVGLAFRSKEFYRFHKDIDLAIFKEDLEEFSRHLERNKYNLVKHRFMTHISPWHDLYGVTKVSASSIENYDTGRVKIRGLKLGAIFRIVRQRSEMFDIFLWEKSKNGVTTVGYNTTIPWEDFNPVSKISSNSRLQLPNINYKKYLAPRVSRQFVDFKQAGIDYNNDLSENKMK